MSYETIIVELHGAVTLIRLNRPDVMNAISTQMISELINAFTRFEADSGQRCAVLTGDERAFAAGGDIKMMADKTYADFYLDDITADWSACVAATRKPWIAAVGGFALGGGCELAMMADFIICADDARFGQPEIRVGIAPGMGGSQRLARAVGKGKAMEMCLTGRTMDAEEAERGGLVVRVVAAADLLIEALKTAAKIAAMPPIAAMVNKEMVNVAFETTLAQGLFTESRLFQALTTTEDKKEGMAAFVEKRKPVWKGR